MLMAWTALLSVVVLSVAFYIAIRQHDFNLHRIALSNSVLIDYLSLSSAVHQHVNSIASLVEHGSLVQSDDARDLDREIAFLVDRVSRSIRQEIDLMHRSGDVEGLASEQEELARFENVSQLIIDMIGRCEQAVGLINSGQEADAHAELRLLLSAEVLGQFDSLLGELQVKERNEVLESQASAEMLSKIVFLYLPLFTGAVFVAGMMIWTMTIRGIDKSVDVLGTAVDAFASGDLKHRVGILKEQELDEIGRAFNDMAERLSQNIDQQQGQRVALERMVAQRTSELKMSNEALAKSDRNRSRLLSDISHELRTPLTVIRGESELALRGEESNLLEYRSALSIIRDQALHMSRLVDDLLFVARSREGQVRLKKSTIKIDQLLHEVCTEFRAFSKDRDILIQEKFACPDQTLLADEGRLRQVFSILIDNALRYSVTGSEVRVVTQERDGMIEISVQDDGIGLSEKDLKEVFTRFYRGDLAKRKVDGSGLGLPVAKAIVSAHNGTIELMNNESRGATARVVVPIYQEETLST